VVKHWLNRLIRCQAVLGKGLSARHVGENVGTCSTPDGSDLDGQASRNVYYERSHTINLTEAILTVDAAKFIEGRLHQRWTE
jgi:hypothetical protein